VLVADIYLDDFLIWGVGPIVASLGVLITGLVVRRQLPRAGGVMLLVGLARLVLSVAWVAFIFYVDAVLGDT
jgi:hypothetical protein